MTDTTVKFLKPSLVSRMTGLSRTTLWRTSRQGDFPPNVPLSPGRVGYPAAKVAAWIEERERAAK